MKSHGDGRRMTVGEAVTRRARMIRVHGSLRKAWQHGVRTAIKWIEAREDTAVTIRRGRGWTMWRCVGVVDRHRCPRECFDAGDVALVQGQPAPMCSQCRAAQR